MKIIFVVTSGNLRGFFDRLLIIWWILLL